MEVVVWPWIHDETKIISIWADNRGVIDWVSNGGTLPLRARGLLGQLLTWYISAKVHVFVLYIRSGHNSIAYTLTSEQQEYIEHRATESKWQESKLK